VNTLLIGAVMNPEVDGLISRSKKWSAEMSALRSVLLDAGLTEEVKWAKPCYTHGGKNIVIVQEMREFLALMFFKGALLRDPAGVLEDQGPNSRSARRITFTSTDDVARLAETVEQYVREAVAVEETGLALGPAPALVLVEELTDRLRGDPELEAAFESLTPGRRREYNLYFSGAKQTKTRTARIEKYASKILEGKGLRDR
jgi:uncharacterized protein YdeI (YjbR/CyaY-like superfamily)